MRYISTRGDAPALDFEGVLLAGLADDGGLYVPESWPQLSAEALRQLQGLDYAETAFRVTWPFVEGTLDQNTYRTILKEAYASFGHEAVTPLVQFLIPLTLILIFQFSYYFF
jgi:threonine synthase